MENPAEAVMMTNEPTHILKETVLSFRQVAARLPPGRNNRPVHPGTVWRWAREGVRCQDGTMVYLESVKVGKRWFTSLEALQRFAVAQTPVFEESL